MKLRIDFAPEQLHDLEEILSNVKEGRGLRNLRTLVHKTLMEGMRGGACVVENAKLIPPLRARVSEDERCSGGCSRGGDGPSCGLPGCVG